MADLSPTFELRLALNAKAELLYRENPFAGEVNVIDGGDKEGFAPNNPLIKSTKLKAETEPITKTNTMAATRIKLTTLFFCMTN